MTCLTIPDGDRWIKTEVHQVREGNYIYFPDPTDEVRRWVKTELSKPKWDKARRAYRVNDDGRTAFRLAAAEGRRTYTRWDAPP